VNFKKGTITLILGWVSLPVTGYVFNIWLARNFEPEIYGVYGLVISMLIWLQIFVITGLPHSVQKFVSSDEQNAYSILWTTVCIQLVVAVCLFIIVFFATPLLARLFHDRRLILYCRVAFLQLLFYGFFHLLVAFQNGLRRFGKQATLLIIYSLSKLGFVFLLVYLFRSIMGAFLAHSAGAVVGLAVGILFLKEKMKQPFYDMRKLIRFAIPTLLYSLMITFLLYIDLWVVRYFLEDKICGFFVASSNIARIPYFLVVGLSATVLPTVSRRLASGALNRVRSTIEFSIRFFILMVVPIGILIMMFSRDIMTILYSSAYSSGGPILSVLIWGVILIAFLYLLTTIIIADNRPKIAFSIAVVAVVLDVLFNILLVPKYGAVGGALSTTIAAGVTTSIAMVYVYRRFRVLVHLKSLLRIGTAGILILAGGKIVDVHGFSIIWLIFFGFFCYGLLLFLFGEIQMGDLREFFTEKERSG